MIAAGLALHRHAGAPVSVPVLLGISGLLITVHPPPYGPTGLALFIARRPALHAKPIARPSNRSARTTATGMTRWAASNQAPAAAGSASQAAPCPQIAGATSDRPATCPQPHRRDPPSSARA